MANTIMAKGEARSGNPKQSGSTKAAPLVILETREFPGTFSYPKPQQIPRGAAQDSLNFLTRLSWVETRGGYHPLGNEVTGAGKCLGIFTAHDWAGNEIVFKATLDGKLMYYTAAIGSWTEVGGAGANILALAAAAGENVYMDEYLTPSGAQLWVSSPSSDLIKIMTANPGSWLSQYNTSKNFKGRIRIIQNSLFLWHYKASTLSPGTNATLQRSYIDSQNYITQSDNNSALVTTVTPTTITGTLTKNAVANATAFGISIVDTDTPNETFTDDYLGNLIGSLGGTGVIDYSTGIFSITPKNPTVSPSLAATYSLEDSTNGGIADFTKASTRLAGQGVAWLQQSGGDILSVNPYNGSYYVIHQRNAWVVTPSQDDSTATNIIYRNNLSLASERGSTATADGVYYVDTTISSKPYIGLLTYDPYSAQVLPIDLSSEILDLSPFVFDMCDVYQWSDLIVFGCRTQDSNYNNRMVAFNFKLSGTPRNSSRDTGARRIFDTLDYLTNGMTTFAGQLVAGDPISNNAYKLFDGFDDDGSIPNYSWTGNQDDHGIPGLKKTKKLWAEGFIATNQSVDVYVQLDAKTAIKVGTISGQGAYVDTTEAVTLGSVQVGVYPIPGPNTQPIAYHYLIQITINSALYKYFTIQFNPTGIGYFSFQMYANYNVIENVDKLPLLYRNNQAGAPLTISGGGTGAISPYISIYTETPQGLVNGTNVTYTTQHQIHTVFNFEINGEQIGPSNYSLSGNTITFGTALAVSLAGTEFYIVYD